MKILMSCRQHPFHLCGGLSIASWNTAKAARDAGHEVHYVTGAHPDKTISVEEGIEVRWLPMKNDSHGYPFMYKWFRDNMKLFENFDILHSQSSALTTLLDMGKPIIFQDHGTQLAAMQDDVNMIAFGLPERFGLGITRSFPTDVSYSDMYPTLTLCLEGQKEIEYLRRFTRVLATSEISAQDLWTRYYLRNVSILYHPIYGLPEFTPRPAHALPVVGFFTLALDAPQKYAKYGLTQLLSIKDKIKVKLIGNGPTTDKWARENFPNVEYTGYLQEEQAIKALSDVDVLFECSCHHRGCNLTGITALGLGVPILTYPTGGHPDLVGGSSLSNIYGPGGALVDPFDDEKAVEALMHLIANREAFSTSAKSHFDARFHPKVCAQTLDAVYKELVK